MRDPATAEFFKRYMEALAKGEFSKDETISFPGSDPVAACVDAAHDPFNSENPADSLLMSLKFIG